MDNNFIIKIEEYLNSQKEFVAANKGNTHATEKYDNKILELIDSQVNTIIPAPNEKTIYEEVITYIKKMKNPRFIKKNGEVKEATFYQYAYVDKSTWSDMKWNKIKIKKKTLFKLILALELDKDQADELLAKGGEKFDFSDL